VEAFPADNLPPDLAQIPPKNPGASDMAYDSFGQFVQALEKAGELKRIRQPVATELEITEWPTAK
jgi:hypothetical protein